MSWRTAGCAWPRRTVPAARARESAASPAVPGSRRKSRFKI
jgi:hypothetical protein